MKLERLHEYILSTVVIILGIAFALFAGTQLGKGQPKVVIIVLVALPLILAAAKYTTKLWILIPLSSGLGGMIVGLPLALPLCSLITLYVFLVFLALKALKIVRTKQNIETIDLILLIFMAYLGFVFIRNPVGALGFDADRIGGRPYFQIGIAFLGYWVLSLTSISPKLARKLPALMTIAPILEGLAGAVANFFPQQLTQPLGRVYSSFAAPDAASSDPLDQSIEGGRYFYLATPGGTLLKTLLSYFTPETLLNPLYIGRFLMFLIGFACGFASGFRSLFADVAFAFLIATYLKGGLHHLIRLFLVTIPMLFLLVAGQGILYDLPSNVQRTLSFLPGQWDPNILVDTQHSNEWRYAMWKEALYSDRYIQDKVFGDGFGVKRTVYEAVQRGIALQISQNLEAEALAIMGQFHNGALQAVRVIGFVGLGLYFFLLYGTAFQALRVLKRCKGTPFYTLAFLMTLLSIGTAVDLLHGGAILDFDVERTIFRIGMLNLISRSLNEYLESDLANLKNLRPARVELRDTRSPRARLT